MKTEQEIRKHLADLEMAVKEPCSCREDGHGSDCIIGEHLMDFRRSERN